jgi:hypothetical protein
MDTLNNDVINNSDDMVEEDLGVVSLPCYDKLKSLSETLPSDKSKKELLNKELPNLSKLGPEGAEMIFALIYHHHLVNGGEALQIPYKAKGDKDVKFFVDDLPLPLRRILYSLYTKDPKVMRSIRGF